MEERAFSAPADVSPSQLHTSPEQKASKKKSLPSGKVLLLLAALLLAAFTAGYRYGIYSAKQSQGDLQLNEGLKIAVHVKGAVSLPGVYLFDADQRVADAVQAAQPLNTADLHQLNLAAYLLDGSQIQVPYKAEKNPTAASGLLNINTATAEQLESLPGIGPSKAQDILAYREKHGYFSSVEDLKQVTGLSSTLIEEIRGLICVE